MEHFSKTIRTREGNLTFYFNRIFTEQGIRYHISVIGKDKRLVTFRMENRNNKWYIDDEAGCPDWILNLESGISQIILDNLSG